MLIYINMNFVKNEEEFDSLLKKRGTKITYNCKCCGKMTTISYREDRDSSQRRLLCLKCAMKDTNLKKYGTEYSSQDKNVREKIRDTVISKKGIDCEKDIWVKDTEEFCKVLKKSKVRIHYNCLNCGKESSFIYKKYDFDRQKRLLCCNCSRKEKSNNIKIIINAEDITSDIKDGTVLMCHCLNCNNPYKVIFRKDRISNFKRLYCPLCQKKETSTQKYGTPYFSQSNEARYKRSYKYLYDNEVFDSSWELALWIYAKDNNLSIIHEPVKFEYTYNNTIHTYYPDFLYNKEYVEVKGSQFFNKDGTMCNPFDHSLDGLFEAKHQCMLKNNVKILGKEELTPILNWIIAKYSSAYLGLFKKDIPFPYPNQGFTNKSDLGVIQYFHKSLYSASRIGKLSPLMAWENKELVKKSALNRLKYVGHCEPSDIIQGFNVDKIAPKVSLFKPSLAESLINKYLQNFTTIIDPFSGFSGRMLGSCNCGKYYIGFDINEDHVRESNEIISYKGISKFCHVNIEDIITAKNKSYENSALFTCPPYGGKEHWNENNDEIEKFCDEWIDLCLEKYKCDKYLFVVDKTEKYKNCIVETITNKSHLGENYEYVILM